MYMRNTMYVHKMCHLIYKSLRISSQTTHNSWNIFVFPFFILSNLRYNFKQVSMWCLGNVTMFNEINFTVFGCARNATY